MPSKTSQPSVNIPPSRPQFLPPDMPGLVPALATVDPKTGKITAPILEQILTQPYHGPALMAAIHVLGLAYLTLDKRLAESPQALLRIFWRELLDIFWKLLNSTPHVFCAGVDPNEPRRFNSWMDPKEYPDQIRDDIEGLLRLAATKISKMLLQEYRHFNDIAPQECTQEEAGE